MMGSHFPAWESTLSRFRIFPLVDKAFVKSFPSFPPPPLFVPILLNFAIVSQERSVTPICLFLFQASPLLCLRAFLSNLSSFTVADARGTVPFQAVAWGEAANRPFSTDFPAANQFSLECSRVSVLSPMGALNRQ